MPILPGMTSYDIHLDFVLRFRRDICETSVLVLHFQVFHVALDKIVQMDFLLEPYHGQIKFVL